MSRARKNSKAVSVLKSNELAVTACNTVINGKDTGSLFDKFRIGEQRILYQ